MEKNILNKLFDLKSFEKVCSAKNPVPLTTFDIDLFIKRHKVIIHVADDDGDTYPYDVEINGELEYCGREDNMRFYKIPFSAQKNDLIFVVNNENIISQIIVKGDMKNPKSLQAFVGILVVILRNVGLNVEEIQAVNALIQSEADYVFHWCEETERFVFINAIFREEDCYFGFFAAVE